MIGERGGTSLRTLLFYNHYDVQPPEPLELWEHPPFEPTLQDGKLYGRGVSDDKGHIAARLHALDALLAVDGDLPCRVKFVIEGEEEVSSKHLPEVVRAHKRRLGADACVWEFGGVDHEDAPLQYLGLRGICYVELSVETGSIDAHSGIGGSIFPNAAWRLTWALASLKGPDERIRIPGFYDPVRPPSARDRELMAALPETADEYRTRYGLAGFLRGLEGGVELRLAEVFEPTCTICGLTSGYQGPGSKTVLPARASAKVDFRLVPDQTPEEVLRELRAHLDAEGFADVRDRLPRRRGAGAHRSRPSVREAGGRDGRAGLRASDGDRADDRRLGPQPPLRPRARAAGGHRRHGLPRHPRPRPQREHPRRPLPQARAPHGARDGGVRGGRRLNSLQSESTQ